MTKTRALRPTPDPKQRAITITASQAALLTSMQAAVNAAQQQMSAALAGVIGGHDITEATAFDLNGTTLTVTLS